MFCAKIEPKVGQCPGERHAKTTRKLSRKVIGYACDFFRTGFMGLSADRDKKGLNIVVPRRAAYGSLAGARGGLNLPRLRPFKNAQASDAFARSCKKWAS